MKILRTKMLTQFFFTIYGITIVIVLYVLQRCTYFYVDFSLEIGSFFLHVQYICTLYCSISLMALCVHALIAVHRSSGLGEGCIVPFPACPTRHQHLFHPKVVRHFPAIVDGEMVVVENFSMAAFPDEN